MGNKLSYSKILDITHKYGCRISYLAQSKQIVFASPGNIEKVEKELKYVLKKYPWFYVSLMGGYVYIEEINPYGTKIVELYEGINGKSKK